MVVNEYKDGKFETLCSSPKSTDHGELVTAVARVPRDFP